MNGPTNFSLGTTSYDHSPTLVQKTTPALRSSSARDAAPGKHGKWPIATSYGN